MDCNGRPTRLSLRDMRAQAVHALLASPRGAGARVAADIAGLPDLCSWDQLALDVAIAEDAAAFVLEDRVLATQRLDAVRVALTVDQVDEFALPTAPAKTSDSRSHDWTDGTCQLEALPPDTLAEIVREAIEEHLDLERYDREVDAERDDRAELLGLPRGDGA